MGEIESTEQREGEEAEVDTALAIFGLVAVRPEMKTELLYLWPENVKSWNVFQRVMTQWNHRLDGDETGLNYAGVESAFRLMRIKRRDQDRIFKEVQVMERASLLAWQERRNNG